MSDAIPFQSCTACGKRWALPRTACPVCGAAEPETRAAGGEGEVWSLTEVHRAAPPAFAGLMPYTLALVTLAEGPRVLGHAAPGLRVGQAVTGRMQVIDTADGPLRLPVFRPVG